MTELAEMIQPYLATHPALLKRVEEAVEAVEEACSGSGAPPLHLKHTDPVKMVNIKSEFKQEKKLATSAAL